MATRPTFKQQNSFGPGGPGPEYEMKPVGKSVGTAVVEEVSDEASTAENSSEAAKRGTQEDQKDMYRMNKVYLRYNDRYAATAITDHSNRLRNSVVTSDSCPSSATVSFWEMRGCCLSSARSYLFTMVVRQVLFGQTSSLLLE